MISFEELKPFLNIGSNSNNPNFEVVEASYPMILTLMQEVPAAFEIYCGRKFIENDLFNIVRYVDFDDDFIPVNYLPINKISEIKIDGEIFTGDFNIGEYGITIDKLSEKRKNKAKVEIKGFGGFDEIPEDLKMCARKQIVYENQRKDYLGARSVQEGGVNISFEPEVSFLKTVQTVLKKYKHPYLVKM